MSKLQSALVVQGAIDEIAGTTTTPEIIHKLRERNHDSTVAGTSTHNQIRRISAALPGPVAPAVDLTVLQKALGDLEHVSVATDSAPDADRLTEPDLGRLYYALETLGMLKDIKLVDKDRAAPLLNFDKAALKAVRERIKSQLGGSVTAPAKCQGFVRKVRDQYCTVLTTEGFSDKVSMKQMEQVLDPVNWAKCSTFFKDMKFRGLDEQGWSRILEVVGTGSGEGFELNTPLKFWKGEVSEDGSRFVNYDMDDKASEDDESDHLVVIDNGYVMATPLDKDKPEAPGVHLYSSKELLIRGMSPTAAAAMACRLGWADAGDRMFFDIAGLPDNDSRKKGLVAWAPSERPRGAPAYSEPRRPPEEIWELPGDNRKQIINTVADEAKTVVASAAQAVGNVVDRWQDGIDPEDVAAISNNLGDELTRSFQLLFNTALNSVRPGTGRTS